jgi:hypothetical protein
MAPRTLQDELYDDRGDLFYIQGNKRHDNQVHQLRNNPRVRESHFSLICLASIILFLHHQQQQQSENDFGMQYSTSTWVMFRYVTTTTDTAANRNDECQGDAREKIPIHGI